MTFLTCRTNNLQRVIAIALLIFFVVTAMPASAAGTALCFDKEDVHLLPQGDFFLVSCHAPDEIRSSDQSPSATFFTLRQNSQTPCVDVSLGTCDSSISSQQHKKILLPKSTDVLSLIYNSTSIIVQSSQVASLTHYQKYQYPASLFVLKNTVLLI